MKQYKPGEFSEHKIPLWDLMDKRDELTRAERETKEEISSAWRRLKRIEAERDQILRQIAGKP